MDEKQRLKKILKWSTVSVKHQYKADSFLGNVTKYLIEHHIDLKTTEDFGKFQTVWPWSKEYHDMCVAGCSQQVSFMRPLAFMYPKKSNDITSAINLCNKHRLKYLITPGKIDNMLSIKDLYLTVIIDISRRKSVKERKSSMTIDCGVSLSKIKKTLNKFTDISMLNLTDTSAVNLMLSSKPDFNGVPLCERVSCVHIINTEGIKKKFTSEGKIDKELWAICGSGNPGCVIEITFDISPTSDNKNKAVIIESVNYDPKDHWLKYYDNFFLEKSLDEKEVKDIKDLLDTVAGRIQISEYSIDKNINLKYNSVWSECRHLLEVQLSTNDPSDETNIYKTFESLSILLSRRHLNPETQKLRSYSLMYNHKGKYRYYGENADKIAEELAVYYSSNTSTTIS